MRKIARFHLIRNIVIAFRIRKNKSKLQNIIRNYEAQNDQSIFTDLNIKDIIQHLEQFGIFQGIILPKHIVSSILEYAFTANCYANHQYDLGFNICNREQAELDYGKKFINAKYYNISQECQTIKLLEKDPALLEIAARFLKTQPVHTSTSMWWNFPIDRRYPEHQKLPKFYYHADLDDFNFLKFFFYLTDVDMNSGPHIYVQGSHKKKNILYQLLRGRTKEANLINDYGLENIIAICGSAGWGFVEDTFGCHTGTAPIDSPRLLLQIEFATYDYNMQHDIVDRSLLKTI